MSVEQKWPIGLRMVWLTGGLLAINEAGQTGVQIKSNPLGRTFGTFSLSTYAELFSRLRSLGLRIIGTTFVTDPRQLDGLRAPEFRAAGLDGGWPVWDTKQLWRQIAHTSSRNGDHRLLDVAARIAAALQYSQMRLHDLAMSYSSQLHSSLHNKEPEAYRAFKDTNSAAVYKDIHSLFWEMAVLRDVLSEFIAVFCIGRKDATTLSGLLKSLNKRPSTDPYAEEVVRIADSENPGGWLGKFGSYRDCFTHSAPLDLVRGSAFAIQDQIVLLDSSSVPQIYYPLPERPAHLVRQRSQGILIDPSNELKPHGERKHDRAKEPDALEYLHGRLSEFTNLAIRLVARSPVAPQPINLTKDDIIGEIKVSRGS
jgi:hypothetical protein